MADASAEQAFSQWRSTQNAATDSTCRLSKDGNLGWVATKLGYVTLNPLQGINLVENTIVARVDLLVLFGKLGVSHKTKCSGAILNAHYNYAAQCKLFPKVASIPFSLESTSVNPHHNR